VDALRGVIHNLTDNNVQSMATWDTSRVTDFSNLFEDCRSMKNAFFRGIVHWNTSKVTDLSGCFAQCSYFNQPLHWDTSNVVFLNNCFYRCSAFNQLLPWNTSNVTVMESCFEGCTQFNQAIFGADLIRRIWQTNNVTDISSMFESCVVFNNGGTDILLNVPKTTDASRVFKNCRELRVRIAIDELFQITTLKEMLYNCKLLRYPVYLGFLQNNVMIEVQDMLFNTALVKSEMTEQNRASMRARGIYLPLLTSASADTIRAFFTGIKTRESRREPSSDFAVENLIENFTSLSLATQQPPAPPQLIIDQLYSELQELGSNFANKTLFRSQKQLYENTFKEFLHGEETNFLRHAKLCLTRTNYDARMTTGDNCTIDPDYLIRKQLLNDKKLSKFVQNHPSNKNVFVSIQTHGSLISSVNSSGDVELHAFQVPPGCSVTVISLTKPGLLFANSVSKIRSVNDVIEKLVKDTDFDFLDITRFVRWLGDKLYEYGRGITDATISDKCRVFKDGVTGFSGNVVALTYTEGEFLLDKRLEVDDPNEKKHRRTSLRNWNISFQEKNHDPTYLVSNYHENIDTTLDIQISRVVLKVMRESNFQNRVNVLVLDASCSIVPQEDSLKDFGEHYLAFLQQQCELHNLRGGRRAHRHRR